MKRKNEPRKEWLGTKEAAAYLCTTSGRLAFDRCKGVGPRFYRYGGGRKILYRKADLDAYVQQFVCEPQGREVGDCKAVEAGA